MLSLTDTAVTTMKRLAALNRFSATTGLRIAAGREKGEDLAVEFAVEGDPKDEVHDVDGVRVFVAPEAARLLERITLDFEISPAGRFTFCFIIRPWPSGAGSWPRASTGPEARTPSRSKHFCEKSNT